MESRVRLVAVSLLVLFGVVGGAPAFAMEGESGQAALHIDMESVGRGRYLARIAGCNDCHTEGYLLSEGMVPEELWLAGSSLGWRGPWGTTYAVNLRLFVNAFTEEQWVELARHLKARPPMPWYGLNIMTDADLKGLYHLLRHLGPGGEPAPAYVPSGQEPITPYALFPSMQK